MASDAQPLTAEEEEFQLALAISRSEAESKEKEREQQKYGVYGRGSASSGHSSARADSFQQPVVLGGMDASDMDPELARYLNRNYWQKKSEAAAVAPSAPQAASTSHTVGKGAESAVEHGKLSAQNEDQTQADKAQFLVALQSSLEIFINRMRSNSQRGRPIANDSSVQSLFSVISSMHPQLLKYQQEIEDKRAYFEGLQDKLTQLRDAREALDSLRDEHQEKRRREMEDLERLRQIQMMQKLEVMRQKKHDYLEMQRQMALQRLQEQEREMALRHEKQKHLIQMRQMQTFYPQTYSQQPMGNPAGMMMGAPPQTMPASMGPQVPHGMVPGYMAGPQPADSSPAPQMGSYGGQPMSQQGQPSGTDMPSGPGGTPGSMQGPQASGMFMQPGVSQNPYTQYLGQGPSVPGSGSSVSSVPPQMGNIAPGSYQPQGQIPPQAQLHLDGSQPPAVCGPGSSYSMPPSASMGYTSMPPTMDYGSFNMQSLADTLPQQQQPGAMYPTAQQTQQQQQQPQQPPPGQHFPGAAPPPPNQYPPANRSNNQMPPPPQHMHHQQLHHLPPHAQHLQQPSQQESLQDAQLISFD